MKSDFKMVVLIVEWS